MSDLRGPLPNARSSAPEVVLTVRDLRVSFESGRVQSNPVRGIDFDLKRGETLAIVGESGSGKSLTALALLGLAPKTAAVSGTVHHAGRELLSLSERDWRGVRGRSISIVFQDPAGSFDPIRTVGSQIVEGLRIHNPGMRKSELERRAISALRSVGMPNPEARIAEYPHQFSGGMLQRAMIAIAIANQPQVLVADEPTTALDVTIQRQILAVLERARRDVGAATILITHNFGIVAEAADRALVVYAGKVVESGPVRALFAHPRHPYTRGLLASVPRLDSEQSRLRPIPGNIPDPSSTPNGCAFHPRCDVWRGRGRCVIEIPRLRGVVSRIGTDSVEGQSVACHFADEIGSGDGV